MGEVEHRLASASGYQRAFAAMCLLFSPLAVGSEGQQTAAAVSDVGKPVRLKLALTPPLDAVQAALDAALLGKVRVTLRLTHDAAGVVGEAAIETSSGDDDVDDALLAWAKQARVDTTHAGSGIVSVRLDGGHVPLMVPQLIKDASTAGIEQALKQSHLVNLDVGVIVTVNAKGKAVGATVVPSTRDKPLDAEIVKWAMRNRYSVDTPGIANLPLRLTLNVLGDAEVLNVRILAPAGVEIADHPSAGIIGRALSDNYLDHIRIEADIDYDAKGVVTGVKIVGSVGSIVIEQKLREWIHGIRIRTQTAGSTRIGVVIEPE